MKTKKKNRRAMTRHYRQAAGPVVKPATDKDVAELLSGGTPSEASKELRWTSGKAHVAHLNNINWANSVWLLMVHLGAIAAPWTFTWSGLLLVVILHWVCGGIGICLGFHRMLTHASFGSPKWVRNAIATIGCLAGEGPPMMWVANHRLHHARSDQEGDPHSPRDGGWWSHVFWLAFRVGGRSTTDFYKKWAPDLYRERFLRGLEYAFLPLNFGLSAIIMAIGYAIDGWPLAVSWLVWGVCVRMVFVLHSTWLVNSASHMWV